jgi:hypothetical protein
MTICLSSHPVKDAGSTVEGAAVEPSMTANADSAEFALLLSQVRSELLAAGCAGKIDAERWLRSWLETPNVAFDNVRPRSLLKQVQSMPDKK